MARSFKGDRRTDANVTLEDSRVRIPFLRWMHRASYNGVGALRQLPSPAPRSSPPGRRPTRRRPLRQDRRIERLVGAGITWKLAGQAAIQPIRLLTVARPGALPHPRGLRHGGDRDRARGVRSDRGRHGHRIRPGADRDGAEDGPLDGLLGLDRLRASGCSCSWRRRGADRGVHGRAGRRRRWWSPAGSPSPSTPSGSTSQAVFMREMRFRSIELRSWLALVIGSVVGITAAAAGAGPWALVLQQIALHDHPGHRALVARGLAPDASSSRARCSASWARSRSGSRAVAGPGWPSCSSSRC